MVEEFFAEEHKILPVIFTAIFLLLFMAVALVVFFRFARKKILAQELEKSAMKLANQKRVFQATIETQEEERNRIAQDLHDDISAKLNVVNLHANMLMEGKLSQEESQTALSNIIGVTNRVLNSSRQIAHNLLPPILEKFGLFAALEELMEEFSTTKKLIITYDINYEIALNKKQELHLFRIMQELLNNSIKHGKATRAFVEIKEDLDTLQINYTDNGIGFQVKQALRQNGLGLKNIKSRLAMLDGHLNIKSQQGKGASFHITLNTKSYEPSNSVSYSR